jgi:hypothetical protein
MRRNPKPGKVAVRLSCSLIGTVSGRETVRRRTPVARHTTATIVSELVAEFVEERVRQHPTKAFRLDDLKGALAVMLRDAGDAADWKATDDGWIIDWLDRHPFLIRGKSGAGSEWKPGLNKAALKRA